MKMFMLKEGFHNVKCKFDRIKTISKRRSIAWQGYDVFRKAYGIMMRNDLHAPEAYPERYRELYSLIAVSEYNPLRNHDYTLSAANEYYINLINSNHNNKWIMGKIYM